MMYADTCTACYSCMHSLGKLLYPQTCNEYWSESLSMNGLSMKSLNTIMIEPAVNDVLTKFIHCAAHKDVHSKLMIDFYRLVGDGNFYL